MKRALVMLLLVAGCKSSLVQTPPPRAPIEVGPTVVDEKVSEQEALASALKDEQQKYLEALQAYERGKLAFGSEIASMLKKAKANARSVTQVEEMVVDGQRISNELIAATKALFEALLDRSEASRKLLTADGRLVDVEWKEFGKTKASAQVSMQVQSLRAREKELHDAQKAEQDALTALDAKEQEVTALATSSTDSAARDQADQQLTDLRATLDASFKKLLDAAGKYDAAADMVHRKLQAAALADDASTGAKLQQLLDARTQAAMELSHARARLKDATIKRAESRSQELGYDAELNLVLHSAFAKPKQRDAFLETISSGRQGNEAALAELAKEELALGDLRRQIVTKEKEAQALLW